MQSHHVLRTLRKAGDLVEVQRRGVAGQDGARLHHGVKLLEYSFLDAHFLEHGLDHQIGIFEVGIVEGGGQQGHALVVFVLLELAALDLRLVVLADGGKSAVQRVLLHLQHLHGNAGIKEVHGNAAAHGSSTDHGNRFDVTLGGVRWHIRNLGGGALGQEEVA